MNLNRSFNYLLLSLFVLLAPQLCFASSPQGKESQNGEILVWASEMPKFNGGNIEVFRKWVQDRVRRPSELKSEDIAGRVVVTFVVVPSSLVTLFVTL